MCRNLWTDPEKYLWEKPEINDRNWAIDIIHEIMLAAMQFVQTALTETHLDPLEKHTQNLIWSAFYLYDRMMS